MRLARTDGRMRSVRRRATYYLVGTLVVMLISTALYDLGMRTFEPRPYPPEGVEVSLLHSMQVVVETFTATGYGSDSPWLSPEMNLLVILLDVTGVGLFFLALPAVFLPLFRQVLSPSVPTEAPTGLRDHVVICTFTSRAASLIGELESNGVEYVLVEPDVDRAKELRSDGYDAIHADPENVSDLERANVGDARALVADVSDRVDASIVLAAKEVAEDVEVVSVVDDPELAPYHRLAGADHVLTPRRLLAAGIAGKITTAVTSEASDSARIDEDFEIAELPVHRGSQISGETLAESDLRERYGVNVIGVWLRGEFETPPPTNTPLDAGTILLVTGQRDDLDRLRTGTTSTVRRFRRGRTIVVGYGTVGRGVVEALSSAGIPHTVVDRTDHDGVDVVGNATDPETFQRADIESSQSIVFALPDDTATEFATLVVRDVDPETEIVARAERTRSVPKIYRAGADYVLSLATVSGRSIASTILEEEILSVGTNVEILKAAAPGLDGETLAGARIRERTGCTVVAVERNGETFADLDPGFRFGEGDRLVIAGTDEGTNEFLELFG